MPANLVQKFLQLESASGIILFSMAVLAMLWANSPLAFLHQQFISASLFVVNDGLMALFFLVVGLELKRAFLGGQLSNPAQIMLPLMAALGGMIVPALIYTGFNWGSPDTLKAWATPVATDIAFAVGVLSLFGKRVPNALKVFLLALAIFDDLGAILIIAFYLTGGLSWFYLGIALFSFLLLIALNRFGVTRLSLYLILGVLLWITLLKSGIHPTIAGVLLAFTVPARSKKERSPLYRLEEALHPWVAYGIMPLFALVNAGFPLSGITSEILTSNVVLGIALGLFLGKQIGVFTFAWAFIRFKWASLPPNASWLTLYGVAILCGIGFTMSLFLGTLAFANDNTYLVEVRLGVIMGSIFSSLVGAIVLLVAFARKRSHIVGLQ